MNTAKNAYKRNMNFYLYLNLKIKKNLFNAPANRNQVTCFFLSDPLFINYPACWIVSYLR